MLFYIRKIFQLLGIAVLWPAFLAHAADCSITQPHTPTEEQTALIHGDFGRAETLYLQKIVLQPKDSELTAGLVRTLLAEQKVDKAESTVKAALAATPQSVELLTALAEVQYRQGFPWDEEKTLSAALQADSCYPRLHLVFASYYWFNSYNASAVREVKLAHQLDPNDYDIQSRWIHTLPLKQRIDELKKYLAAYDLDADRLHGTQHELALLEDRLANQTGFCKLASPVTSTEIPLTPLLTNANRIREWSLDVFFNDHKSHLLVDTTIHGLYVSRSMAEHAGLKLIAKYETDSASGNDKQVRYTAYADSIKIGNLEFNNCLVEVRDISSVIDADGWIGMDVFSRFLVTLDYPWRKLTLEPLRPYPDNTATPTTLNTEQETPAENSEAASASGTAQDAKLPESTASSGPHDRYIAPEMKNWDTVYRVGPTMIVPTVLNNKRMRLFVLETGSVLTYISSSAASEVTNVRSANPGSLRPLPPAAQIHTGDKIVFRFAHLQQEKENVLSFDTSPISKRLGTEISGMFGFDLLGLLVMRIDYRDGLMSFEYSADRGYQHIR